MKLKKGPADFRHVRNADTLRTDATTHKMHAEKEKNSIELKETKSRKTELERMTLNPQSQNETLKKSYKAIELKRDKKLADLLSLTQHHEDPLAQWVNFCNSPAKSLFLLPPWEVFEKAAKSLQHGILSKAQKDKQLAQLQNKIDSLTAKIKETLKNERCQLMEQFVYQWKNTQSQINKPVNCNGVDLDISHQAEKEAWALLGISEDFNPAAVYSPAHPPPAD
jgi:hypothetical protein